MFYFDYFIVFLLKRCFNNFLPTSDNKHPTVNKQFKRGGKLISRTLPLLREQKN